MSLPFRRRRLSFFLLLGVLGALRGEPAEAGEAASPGPEQTPLEALARVLRDEGIPWEEHTGSAASLDVKLSPAGEATGDPGARAEPAAPGAGIAGGNPEFILVIPLGKTTETSYGVEAGLVFIRKSRGRRSGPVCRVVFLETSRREEWEDIYSRLEDPGHTALVYLDIPEAPGELAIHHGGGPFVSPRQLLAPLTGLCEDRKIPYRMAVKNNIILKLGLT